MGYVESKLMSRVEKTPEGCWIWGGAKNSKGYGICYRGLVHRTVYAALVGEIPEGRYILHKCDIRGCCNPAHLYAGTQKDNMRDMLKRGRIGRRGQPAGEGHALAKLTWEKVHELRSSAAGGASVLALSLKYGVSQSQTKRIIKGQRWVVDCKGPRKALGRSPENTHRA